MGISGKPVFMPAQIDDEKRKEIVYLRALDYEKQEIAEKVGVSRNTVRRHLNQVREDVESSDSPKNALADYLFDFDELLPYIIDRSTGALSSLDQNISLNLNLGDSEG